MFGGAAGRASDGTLTAGKLLPRLQETNHLPGHPGPTALSATQLESSTRLDEKFPRDLGALTMLMTLPGAPTFGTG